MTDDLRDWLDARRMVDPAFAAAVDARLAELREPGAVVVDRVPAGAAEARATAGVLRSALPGTAQLLDRLADRLEATEQMLAARTAALEAKTAEQQTQMAILTAIRQDCDAVPGVAREREAARLAGARGAVTVLLARYQGLVGELTALKLAVTAVADQLATPGEASRGEDAALAAALRRAIGFTCPVCHRTSHHPEDIRHQYCPACHTFPEGRP